jgi:hypothetical protein
MTPTFVIRPPALLTSDFPRNASLGDPAEETNANGKSL